MYMIHFLALKICTLYTKGRFNQCLKYITFFYCFPLTTSSFISLHTKPKTFSKNGSSRHKKKSLQCGKKKNAAVPPKDTLFLKGHFCPYFSSQVEIKNMNIESEAFVCRNRYDHHIEQYLVGVINHLYEAFTTLLLN